MNTFILLFLLILFFSILGFVLNKAEIHSLSQKSKRMVKSRRRRHWKKVLK